MRWFALALMIAGVLACVRAACRLNKSSLADRIGFDIVMLLGGGVLIIVSLIVFALLVFRVLGYSA